jgi:hypothetical protein
MRRRAVPTWRKDAFAVAALQPPRDAWITRHGTPPADSSPDRPTDRPTDFIFTQHGRRLAATLLRNGPVVATTAAGLRDGAATR